MNWNETIFFGINHGWANPLFDALFGWVSQRPAFAFPVLLVILFLLWRKLGAAGVRLWGLLLAVIVLGDLSGNVLKHLLLEPRPCAELVGQVRLVTSPFNVGCSTKPHGMPSNHALNYFITAAFTAGMLRSWRWALGLGGVAVLVGLSRIYLGVHYPSQVLAGAALGIALGALFVALARSAPLARWLKLPHGG